MTQQRLLPDDAHNRETVAHVHPQDWSNPDPAPMYNLVVLGAGTAGLVSAIGSAGLGAKVALVEKHLMGGDCLNVGCVPSKALLRAARAAHDARQAGAFGVGVGEVTVDFPKVMERMRRLRAEIAPNDGAPRCAEKGVDVFLGEGKFTGPNMLAVDGKTLRFRKAVVATGARAVIPDIPGLAASGALTNETVFTLTELPKRLLVIGAGPIGCELSQAFARFGSEVFLVETAGQILPREDQDAARVVEAQMKSDGVRILAGCKTVKVEIRGAEKVVTLSGCERSEFVVDEILVGAGRAPNVAGIGLEAAGVAFNARGGIQVDGALQTTSPDIFAAGDVCFPYKFTHTADAMARIVIQNALFGIPGFKKKTDALTIPWCTYTDPEIAHVGMYAKQAAEAGYDVATIKQELKHVDRAVLDGDAAGFAKLHVDKSSGRVLGATVVARHAGEMIGEAALAVTHGLTMGAIAGTIHPYPTQAEVFKRAADAYNRTRLTPTVAGLFDAILRWKR